MLLGVGVFRTEVPKGTEIWGWGRGQKQGTQERACQPRPGVFPERQHWTLSLAPGHARPSFGSVDRGGKEEEEVDNFLLTS